MTDFVLLGTDTDAGKTTFALLWLAAFAERYDYWKPLESGDSDTEKVAALVPRALCHPRLRHFEQAVAPPLAARSAGFVIPPARAIAAACPAPTAGKHLLIETFGSPFSPLNETELQIELIRALDRPAVLVSSSAVGAVGRTLQGLLALGQHDIIPAAVVLMGEPDAYAAEQIAKHFDGVAVFPLRPPEAWDAGGVSGAAQRQRDTLEAVLSDLTGTVPPAAPLIDWVALDRQYVWHPYASLRDPDPPSLVVGAQDEFLHLADGRKVIDGISSWWTILHGHRHPPLMAALAEAARSFDHVLFAGATHPPAVELARLLLDSVGWDGGRVFYSDNGSTAVEVALKMAYQFWCHRGESGRTLFVGFEHGYHGDTFGAMAASRDPVFFGRFEPLLFRTAIVPVAADRLDETLRRHQGQVAAVILEPLVQGAGGMRMHTPAELADLFEVARRHDVLFVADEVMTGGGRLGPLFAHHAAGITPDLVCVAKTIAGGILPIAATLVTQRVVDAFDTDDRAKSFFHGHSFTAHPLACAVGAANWRAITSHPSPAPARMQAFWERSLAPLRGHELVKDVRVRGSVAAVELAVPGGYLAGAARQMRQTTLARGVYLRPLGNVLYALPPLGTSDESLGRIADAMTAAVEAVRG